RQGGSDFSRGRGRRGSLPQRPDLPPPLPQRPAAVVLLQAAALAEVLGERRDLVVAADRFAARHAQPRVRQGLEAFGGDVGPAPLARTGRDGHSDSFCDRGAGAGPRLLARGYPRRRAPLSLGRRRPAFGSPPAGHRPALHSLPDLFPRKSASAGRVWRLWGIGRTFVKAIRGRCRYPGWDALPSRPGDGTPCMRRASAGGGGPSRPRRTAPVTPPPPATNRPWRGCSGPSATTRGRCC